MAGDLIVFDFDRIGDRSTFAQPTRTAQGILHVIVNGQSVIDGGQTTGARPGRVLRGPGYRPAPGAYQP
jgi:N-acyl-D-amino-acid deacylase